MSFLHKAASRYILPSLKNVAKALEQNITLPAQVPLRRYAVEPLHMKTTLVMDPLRPQVSGMLVMALNMNRLPGDYHSITVR
jgi:hypothetical protein